MKTYLELLREVREYGTRKADRTGTGTLSLFGRQMHFPLADSFPAVTTKKLHFKAVVHELLWFLAGDTNLEYLHRHSVRIWDDWATASGDLGPIYGAQWRSWQAPDGESIDQLQQVLDGLRRRPDSRRHVISAWNPADLPDESIAPADNAARGRMALSPCHTLFQFYVADGALSCQLYQRSADAFLGLPFNIASYSLLTCMMAQALGLKCGRFVHTLGDVHIYLNHLEQVDEQLSRRPYPPPRLELNPEITDLFAFSADHIRLVDYQSHPPIRASIAV